MANSWTHGKYVIDTAENKTIDAVLKYFEWHPNAADDDLIIKDQNGKVLWQIRASAGAPNDESAGILTNDNVGGQAVTVINVEVIDAGTLYIYTY